MSDYMTKNECATNKKACLETNIKPIMDKLDKFENKIDKILEKVYEMPSEIFEKADHKYADKRIEKNFDKIVWLVLAAVLVGILNLVMK